MSNTPSTTSFTIRHAPSTCLIDIYEVHARAFDGQGREAELVIQLHKAKKATISLLCECDGKVVAHLMCSPMSMDPSRPSLNLSGLGPVAVLPAYQRRGIGSHLVASGIENCRKSGVDVIAVLGAPSFYQRFGFRPATQFGIQNEYCTDDHFMVLELRNEALLGVNGLMVYAPEFRTAGF